jgi:hypothetical protein
MQQQIGSPVWSPDTEAIFAAARTRNASGSSCHTWPHGDPPDWRVPGRPEQRFQTGDLARTRDAYRNSTLQRAHLSNPPSAVIPETDWMVPPATKLRHRLLRRRRRQGHKGDPSGFPEAVARSRDVNESLARIEPPSLFSNADRG